MLCIKIYHFLHVSTLNLPVTVPLGTIGVYKVEYTPGGGVLGLICQGWDQASWNGILSS